MRGAGLWCQAGWEPRLCLDNRPGRSGSMLGSTAHSAPRLRAKRQRPPTSALHDRPWLPYGHVPARPSSREVALRVVPSAGPTSLSRPGWCGGVCPPATPRGGPGAQRCPAGPRVCTARVTVYVCAWTLHGVRAGGSQGHGLRVCLDLTWGEGWRLPGPSVGSRTPEGHLHPRLSQQAPVLGWARPEGCVHAGPCSLLPVLLRFAQEQPLPLQAPCSGRVLPVGDPGVQGAHGSHNQLPLCFSPAHFMGTPFGSWRGQRPRRLCVSWTPETNVLGWVS